MDTIRTLFTMSVTGSIIFLIFQSIKPTTKKYFNSSWHYKMLVLTLIFFIIPITVFVEIPIKLTPNILETKIQGSQNPDNFIKSEERKDVKIAEDIKESEPKEDIKAKVKDEKPSTIKATNNIPNEINFNIYHYINVIKYLWIIGMIALLSIKIIPYIIFKSTISGSSIEVIDESTLKIFNQCKNELDIKNKIALRTCDTVGSPMLIGLFHPIVLIPSIDNNDKTLKMIFLHELNHYKRKDIIMKVFGLIINVIHWFNPLIYILLKEIDKYCEYSIDEKVVEEMDINDRKYYGETILSLIGDFMLKKSSLTTAMGTSGKQLKNRLENMIYSGKTTRKRQIISLVIGVLILISGFTVACSILPTNVTEENDSFVVYIKEDGLYYSHFDGEDEIKIHDGNSFEYPLISGAGNYIAYTKEDSLFIYSMKDESYEKIDDGIDHYYMAYDWIDDTSIIYGSFSNPGFTILNVLSKERTEHLDEYYYTGLMSSNNNMVYGTKINRWTTEEGDFITIDGIVEINLNNYDKKNKRFSTHIIVQGRRSTEEMIGYNPIVWDISADGRYIYIMEKPASGSLSSDGIGIGIYDVKEKKHTEFADIDTLSYKNHLAINPSNNMIALIEGAGRDMIENKKVITLDMYSDKSYDISNINHITDEDFVAMTPSFTLDGKKLLYSATEVIDPNTITDYNQIYNEWERQPYSIYEYNLKSSELRKLTEGNDFDFMPIDISNNEILFSRYKGNDYYSLIKLVNGKENIVADNIMFSGGKDNHPFGFYGHIHTEMGMDIFINKEAKPYSEVKSTNQNNSSTTTTDILEQLANQEFFIKEENSSSLNKEIVEFGKSFVNLFNGAVQKQKKVSFEKYISNKNLQRFTDKMLELTQIQDIKGDNDVNYGLENEFGQAELRQQPVDKLWYLELPFQFEGSGMTAKMLITSEDKVLKLVDLYFGSKDGVDTFATGHPADRNIRDPHLWENEDWVKDVFIKLKDFEKMLEANNGNTSSTKDIKKLVEENLSVILSSPKESSNPQDYINAHENEYENFFKYGGEDALQYMLTQFEAGNAEGLRGQIMMKLCKELLGARNNVADESLSPQEWYDALSIRQEILLPDYEYDGEDPIEKLVYDTEIERDSASNKRGGFIIVAPKILGSYEEEDMLKVFVTTYSARYILYGNTLSQEGGSIVPAAITYRKDDNDGYILEKYEQARDGSEFGPSIRKYCTMPLSKKEIKGLTDKILKHYGDCEDILILMHDNLFKHLKKNGITDATLTNSQGKIEFSTSDPKYKH